MACTIRYGVNSVTADSVADKTVGEVRAQVEQLLNIPASAQARVNGSPADDATVIPNGSTIEFVKAAGEKGRQH